MSINDPQDLLPAVGKKYSANIIVATTEPRSVKELSDELDIPIATCYRRIDELVDQGLLEQHETHTDGDGHEVKLYKRSVDNFTVKFGDATSIVLNDQQSKWKIDKIWRMLRSL